ncbi:MAG TPA: hypothetical protein VFI08_08115, partial [Spirochaetia bacterium]|nr:hypothetical protein [Spirochaetia bacterium]
MKWLLPLLIAALSLLLSACPPPVDNAVATAVSDKLPPTVTVTSPKSGDFYSGTIAFTGTATDDAKSAGDGKGTLASLSFDVTNNPLLKGRIKIGSSGTAAVDPTFGSGVIAWANSTKTFSFSINTVGITGTLTVEVTAVDANGNTTTNSVQLSMNTTGPLVVMSSPATSNFVVNSTVVVTGTVANSSTDASSASAIVSLAWTVSVLDGGGTLTGIGTATSPISTNNTGFGAAFNYPFTYTPSTRTFSTQFYIPNNSNTQNSNLTITITATDSNNNQRVTTIPLANKTNVGPNIILDPGTPFYTTNSSAFGTRSVTGTITDYLTVAAGSMKYTIESAINTTNNTGEIPFTPTFDSSGNFSIPYSYSTASAVWASGDPVIIFVEVSNTQGKSSNATISLSPDSTPPTISAITMTSSNGTAGLARSGNTVTLNFTITDTGAGFGSATYMPTVTIKGAAPATLTNTSMNAAATVGTYSATYAVPSGSANDGPITFSITAADQVGNSASASAVTSGSVVSIDNTPPSVVLSGTESPSATATDGIVRHTQTVTITATFADPSGIDESAANQPRVTIGSLVSSATMTKTDNLHWTYAWTVPTGNDGAQPVSITAFDKAGNPSAGATGVTSYTIDNTPPSLTSATFSSTGWLKLNDSVTITLDLAAGETGLSAATGAAVINTKDVGSTLSYTSGATTATLTYKVTDGLHDKALNALPLSIQLTDAAGNTSNVVTTAVGGTPGVDGNPPSGYAATITPAFVNLTNYTAVPMSFSGAELNDSYTYTITSTGGGTPVTGTGTVTSATQGFVLDLSGLGDGTLTVALTLTDEAGNVGSTVNTTKAKDTVPPSAPNAPTSSTGATGINAANYTGGFTVTVGLGSSGAANGDTLTLQLDGSALLTRVLLASDISTGSYTFSVPASDTNLGSDGAKSFTAQVTDAAGNPGPAGSALPLTLDTIAPTAPNAPTSSTGTTWINKANYTGGFTMSVGLGSSGAAAGDSLLLRVGSTTLLTYTL